MNSGDHDTDHIQVAVFNGMGMARVQGRGSYKVSASVKDFGNAMLKSGVSTLVIDLRDCVGLDSTFMGVLAGQAVRFRKEIQGRVVLTNVSSKIQRLVSTLGLNRLVDIHVVGETPGGVSMDGKPGFSELPVQAQTPLESAETMLEAHRDLVEALPENQVRFQDVLDYLREDIRRQRSQ
jgi:anti-sigma B factor antagonist